MVSYSCRKKSQGTHPTFFPRLALTHDMMITCFSLPWNPSTVQTSIVSSLLWKESTNEPPYWKTGFNACGHKLI
ncbi:hypothetical protein DPMN_178224 [Dreissena polymorpha]|uniref:Uncharacterized protein n=1 Tax=Dreissena polymorpha TaxID=45954 RepID=A0A9D4EBN1_DREPO|nr:hypothetical protein DPMN_178224 [Dreissena polymorpha]